jgi:hypothetical protein
MQGIEKVVNYTKNTAGVVFLIAIYHSGSDFNTQNDYSNLENILQALSSDPGIEFSTISEISKKYANYISAHNLAGLNLKQANNAAHTAKPYVASLRSLLRLFGLKSTIDGLFQNAMSYYWSGDYRSSSKTSKEIINECNRLMLSSRITAICLPLIMLILLYGVQLAFKFRHFKKLFVYLALSLVVSILLLAGILNWLQPFSAIRIQEFNMTAALFISAFVVLCLPFSYCVLRGNDEKIR